ncbi:SSI family serine proteinase inhibitor [Streptomyces sp. HSG2]|uniref:SSI family serine proteinase inhibitor n=1 Tax=Streptomyces sp. HSG2 TaxID=2797167 RepID=UPI001904CBF9
MFRLTRAIGAAVLSGVIALVPSASASATPDAPDRPTPATPPARDADRLIVTITGAGATSDGVHELRCRPTGGNHPAPEAACAAVERETRSGADVFAPVPEGTVCTLQYGGPAVARVSGTWGGVDVDARYDRGDGCEIARWDRLVPLLPDMRSDRGIWKATDDTRRSAAREATGAWRLEEVLGGAWPGALR